MKKYLNQFLIVSIIFWITEPLVELFINKVAITGVDNYLNSPLIIKSLVFGLIFTTVYNLILKRY
tara:strand:+ start:147 stop:341 length:195 start_codon:yes stop_codon:yes gene_type:complete